MENERQGLVCVLKLGDCQQTHLKIYRTLVGLSVYVTHIFSQQWPLEMERDYVTALSTILEILVTF